MNMVLVIAATETFTVRGLMMKLSGIGVEAVYCPPKVRELGKYIDDAELFILYTDDTVSDMADSLVYLKDCCLGKEKQMIIVGTKSEHKTVEKYLADSMIISFHERPIEMEKLLDEVEDYLDEDSKKARRKSILVVDDDVSYMSMIHDWLKDSYRVAVAASGMQAITWLAKNHADLILLDYEMPVTPGPQVLEMIRSEAETSSIPVMFLTGHNDKESIMSVLKLKPVDYILKTIDKDGLRGKISDFFISQAIKEI